MLRTCPPAQAPPAANSASSITATEDWKVHRYLHDRRQISKAIDIATGYFEIVAFIRSTPKTPRRRAIADATLSDVRKKVEKHIKNTYLKAAQAPVEVKPVLQAWMELNKGLVKE
mgnify:CR=1 FL=1